MGTLHPGALVVSGDAVRAQPNPKPDRFCGGSVKGFESLGLCAEPARQL